MWRDQRTGLRLLPYALVLPAALGCFLSRVSETPYHVDESGWARAAIHVAELVAALDLRPSSWQCEEDYGYGSINPPIGKLIFALPVLAGVAPGREALPAVRVEYDVSKSLEENKAAGAVIPDEILYPMRRMACLAGAAFCAVCMAMVQRVAGSLAALISGLVFLCSPVIQQVSSTVITDVAYQLFVFTTGLAGMVVIARSNWRLQLRGAAWVGLCLGLATATKYSGAVILLPFFVGLSLLARRGAGLGPLRFYVLLAAGLFSAAVLLFISNPMLWPEVSRVSASGLRADYRLWHAGEMVLDADEAPPKWMWLLHLNTQRLPAEEGKKLLRLTPESLERLRDYVSHVLLENAEPPSALRPQTMMPSTFALLRPAQVPLIYLRWAYYKEWVLHNFAWDAPTNSRFLRNFRTVSLVLPGEGLLAMCGAGLLLGMAALKKKWQGAEMALLLFTLVYLAMLYATRLADYERYLVGMFVLRGMLASIATAFMLRGIAAGLALPWRQRARHPQA